MNTKRKIGVVGTPGGWSSEMLADAVYEMTGFRVLIDFDEVSLYFTTGRVIYKNLDLSELDALIIKKVGARYSPDLLDRLEILRFLYESGIKIYSSPLKIMRVLDRLSCTVTLQLAKIPMPPTIITEDVNAAMRAVRTFGKAVFKPLYTSKARGMAVIEDHPEIKDVICAYKAINPIMYIQKWADIGGKDLGIAFLGGTYLTTYARCNNGNSWNTTTHSGGTYAPYTPSAEIIALAKKAQDLFHLDFTCVDVAETDEGPCVFEVSAFGGFRGIREACEIDAAKLYVEYVLKQIDG